MSRLGFFYQWIIWSKSSLWRQMRFWRFWCIFNSSSSGLVVGYTCIDGLELQISVTGGPPWIPPWTKVLHFYSIGSCLTSGLTISSELFGTPIRRWHVRIYFCTCDNWRKHGTKICPNNFCHNESMSLTILLWSGSSSELQYSYVSATSLSHSEMSDIPLHVP